MKTDKTNTNKNRRSLKGKWGKVGAPPKATKFPRGAFTMESLFNMNKNQCQLSLRNKVDAKLADGSLVALKPRKQAGGKVGRPKAVFVLKDNFDASKHEKADAKAKTPRAKKTQTVVAVSPTPVAPTTPPVPTGTPVAATAPAGTPVAATAPATIEPPVEATAPTPEVSAPVEAPATVIEAPEAPAPEVSAPVVG